MRRNSKSSANDTQETSDGPSRRRFLVAAGASVVALAGCQGEEGGGDGSGDGNAGANEDGQDGGGDGGSDDEMSDGGSESGDGGSGGSDTGSSGDGASDGGSGGESSTDTPMDDGDGSDEEQTTETPAGVMDPSERSDQDLPWYTRVEAEDGAGNTSRGAWIMFKEDKGEVGNIVVDGLEFTGWVSQIGEGEAEQFQGADNSMRIQFTYIIPEDESISLGNYPWDIDFFDADGNELFFTSTGWQQIDNRDVGPGDRISEYVELKGRTKPENVATYRINKVCADDNEGKFCPSG